MAVVIGVVPPWIDLGAPEFRDGLTVRPVLGDWSHLHQVDRPPAFVVESGLGPPLPILGPLAPVEQRYPGKSIDELKGRHSGSVVVLFNGPSLADHNLFRIRTPIIGMNRTYVGNPRYVGPSPDYLCVIDDVWMRNPHVVNHPGFVNGGVNLLDKGFRATRDYRARPFSFDLFHHGYVPLVPGTTGFLALQLAVYLGFTDIVCLGLDLSGGHFDGSHGSQHFAWMNRYFKAIAPVLEEHGIHVTICGSPASGCTAFPHSTFEEACA